MRGASALDEVLASFPEAPIRVVVVWEPVLPTDLARPFSSVLALVPDRRVAQFWDPQRALSQEIVRAVARDPQRFGVDEAPQEDFIVWDVVAVFGPGDLWSEAVPVPTYYDGPVFAVTESLRAALQRALDESRR